MEKGTRLTLDFECSVLLMVAYLMNPVAQAVLIQSCTYSPRIKFSVAQPQRNKTVIQAFLS